MGYLAPSQGQGPLAAPTAADLAAMGTGSGIGSQIVGQMGLDSPTLAQFAPQASQGISQVDPQMLAMMSGGQGQAPGPQEISSFPPSDPNNLTSGPDKIQDPATLGVSPSTAAGSPGQDPSATNAGDVGASGNPATNAYTPGGAADQGAVATASGTQQVAPKLTDWQQYLTDRGIGPQSIVDVATHRELIKGFNDLQIKKLEIQDPAHQLEIQAKTQDVANNPLKTQNLQAQTAESQSKVIAGELAKQQAIDSVNNQIADLQTQSDNLKAVASSPELKNMTGLAGQFNPGLTDPQRDLRARLEQISGQQLIGGINKIKDEASNPNGSLGMRITQQEAIAVKNAVQRLQRFQDPNTFSSSANEAASFLDRSIAAKQAQLARMPGVNQDLLKQFNYAPASAADPSSTGTTSSASQSAPVRIVGGITYQQNPATGGWRPVR